MSQQNKAHTTLHDINRLIGGEVLTSKRNVPYLRWDYFTTVCYFGRTDKIRVFEKIEGTDKQKRTDFKDWRRVVCYLGNREKFNVKG